METVVWITASPTGESWLYWLSHDYSLSNVKTCRAEMLEPPGHIKQQIPYLSYLTVFVCSVLLFLLMSSLLRIYPTVDYTARKLVCKDICLLIIIYSAIPGILWYKTRESITIKNTASASPCECSLIFGKSRVRISVRKPAILTDIIRGLPQFLQVNSERVPTDRQSCWNWLTEIGNNFDTYHRQQQMWNTFFFYFSNRDTGKNLQTQTHPLQILNIKIYLTPENYLLSM